MVGAEERVEFPVAIQYVQDPLSRAARNGSTGHRVIHAVKKMPAVHLTAGIVDVSLEKNVA
jgi:hypothetical protein